MQYETQVLSKEKLIEEVKRFNSYANFALIEKAYDFAKKAHEGQKRASGEHFFLHPVEVARILIRLRADTATICAALLHDIVEDTTTSIETVEKKFGKEITELVKGLTKTQDVIFESKEEYNAENLRKILLATTKDIRIILIRLADRLHNMRTLSSFREEKRRRIAKETLEIYAPIAHKLGIWKIKGELEDLTFKYLEPKTYHTLKEKITEKRAEREKITLEIVKNIEEELKKQSVEAQVFGRAKFFFSIYKKMLKKGKDLDKIYDLIAIRIITKTIQECYKSLGIVHTLYKPVPGRLKDYIAHPKANAYQSIHTSVFFKNKILEVQIRTEEMHHIAEEGVAAHWRYKGTERDKKFDKKIAWLKQILDWKRKSKNAKDFVENLRIDLFENEIIVFTPKGDPISLPVHATPIDFAYAVHTNLGHQCSKTKVNGKIVPLDYDLKSGEVVEIIPEKKQTPSRAWLNFAKTSKAKQKIKQKLNIEIEHRPKQARLKYKQKIVDERKINPSDYIAVEGKKMPLKLSKCCEPKINDEILGFYTKDNKITVHKKDCSNAIELDEKGAKKAKLSWKVPDDLNLRRIKISMEDKPGILVKILNSFALLNIKVKSVNTKIRKDRILLNIKIIYDDKQKIANVIEKINNIQFVNSVRLE